PVVVAGERLCSLVDDYAASAFADLANDTGCFAARVEQADCSLRVLIWNNRNHADATVERPVHLDCADARRVLKPVEHRIAVPTSALEHHLEPIAQNAR